MDATAWDERYRERELVWSQQPNVFVAHELEGLPPGRALDLGAGEGRNAIWLASKGWEVEAVEFSQVALDKARAAAERAGVEVTFTYGDLTDPPELQPADLVVLAYLQLPRAQGRRVLRLAASLVRAGGTLLSVAHARRNLYDGVGGPQDPDLLQELDELLEDLAETGLAIDRATEVTRTVETDEGEREAIDVLVRASRPT